MFSKEYWYLGLLTLLVVTLTVLVAMEASRHKYAARAILCGLGLFVLVYQSYLLAQSGVFYVAFSYFCYFLFAIAVFVPLRPLKATAAFGCLLSGGIYLGAFLFYPDIIVGKMVQGAGVWTSWLMHVVMFSGGLLLLGQYGVNKWDIIPVLCFAAFFAAYTEIATYVFHSQYVNPVSTGVVEGTLILQVAPDFVIQWWWYIVWYVIVALLFWALWVFTRFINRRLRPYRVMEKFRFFAI